MVAASVKNHYSQCVDYFAGVFAVQTQDWENVHQGDLKDKGRTG